MRLKLDRSVQFLYEGYLAGLELQSLGCTGLERDPADWTVLLADVNGNAGEIVRRSAYFESVDGKKTHYSQLIRPGYQEGRFNRTRSVNQYLTHWIYPYQGKFHPQMVRGLLNILGARPGMTVGDFFSGSGTTAVEASLLGFNFVGVDLSPLCVLLARVKTQSAFVANLISKEVDRLLEAATLPLATVRDLRHENSHVSDFFQMACLLTASDTVRRGREEQKALRKNLATMRESVVAHAEALEEFEIAPGSVTVSIGDARDTRKSGVRDSSIDIIVTSPPYSIALDYIVNDKHALDAMGLDTDQLRDSMTGVRGRSTSEKLKLYNQDMKAVFKDTARILSPGGRAAFVIGDATVDKSEWTTTSEMVEWACDAGLVHDRSIDKIVFGLYSVMKDEKILVFRKPG